MTLLLNEATPVGPGELRVEVLGHPLRVHTREDQAALAQAVELLEQTFRDMEQAYELRWGSPPSALDTSTWMLMGALNLAHRLVRLEQEASQQTQDLEQKLTKLLDDVPDDPLAPGPLFGGKNSLGVSSILIPARPVRRPSACSVNTPGRPSPGLVRAARRSALNRVSGRPPIR